MTCTSSTVGALARRALVAALVCASAGCAEQRIRDQSDQHLRNARYEQAVAEVDEGLKQYPGSTLLRSAGLMARNEALGRLLQEANRERAQGNLDAAEALLQRAKAFDSSGQRALALLAELAIERRQRAALAQAQELADARQHDKALQVLTAALKDNPRQPDLLALQRRMQAELRQSALRQGGGGLAEARYVTLDFRDAGLRTVLDAVSRGSGISFVLDKDVRADIRVSVYLRSAKVEEAIDLIASTHQLAKKVIDERTVLIYPNTPDKLREYQEQVVRVFHLAHADAKGAASFLRAMLKVKEPFVDERSNMVALREPPEVIELAERLMALYDATDAEVLLELEVLEVSTTRLLDLGIQLPDSLSLSPLSPAGGATAAVAGLTLDNLSNLGRDRIGVGIGGLAINLKRQLGDANTLANPRIRVRNKEKARVMIGDKVPVVSVTTGQSGFVADSVSYLDVGLKVDVEPTVYADDDVAMRVNLEVSSITGQVATKSGTLAYQIGTRSASTALRLRDGETQLLAGLINRNERSGANRVPGLGDLPVVGRLFGTQRDENQRSELVLAITPRVVRNLRRLDAGEGEVWIGTESFPRARAPVASATAPRGLGPVAPAQPPVPVVEQPVPGPARGGDPRTSRGSEVSRAVAAAQLVPVVPAAMFAWSGPSEVVAGQTFELTLDLDANTPLRGAPLEFRYNPDLLRLLDVQEDRYFKSDGEPTNFTNAADGATGVIRVGVLRNQASGVQGRAAVLRLKFQAVKPGQAQVVLNSARPVSLAVPSVATAMPAPWQALVR